MRYILKENVEVDFTNQGIIAKRLGIHEVTLSKILNRKQATNKPTAFYITILNGGEEKDIEKYFRKIK